MSVTVVPSQPVDLLIVAAFTTELTGLRRVLGDHLAASVSGVSVACKAVGVGVASAAAGMATRLAQLHPRAVVMVGACGIYPTATLGAGDTAILRRALLVCPEELDGLGAVPEPVARAVEADPALRSGLGHEGIGTVDAATTLAATIDDGLAARIAHRTHCAVESLEAFAVGIACALQGVPFGCVLGAAYRVGPGAREEWRVHHTGGAVAACQVVERWLLAGADGIARAHGEGNRT